MRTRTVANVSAVKGSRLRGSFDFMLAAALLPKTDDVGTNIQGVHAYIMFSVKDDGHKSCP